MAQGLFTANCSFHNQTKILGADNVVDPVLRDAYRLPWFATFNAMSLLVLNIGITATIVYIICWNWQDVPSIFVWAKPGALKVHVKEARADGRGKFWKQSTYVEEFTGTEGDPHFAAIRVYKDAPSW